MKWYDGLQALHSQSIEQEGGQTDPSLSLGVTSPLHFELCGGFWVIMAVLSHSFAQMR
jgi:hypothetical protein